MDHGITWSKLIPKSIISFFVHDFKNLVQTLFGDLKNWTCTIFGTSKIGHMLHFGISKIRPCHFEVLKNPTYVFGYLNNETHIISLVLRIRPILILSSSEWDLYHFPGFTQHQDFYELGKRELILFSYKLFHLFRIVEKKNGPTI